MAVSCIKIDTQIRNLLEKRILECKSTRFQKKYCLNDTEMQHVINQGTFSQKVLNLLKQKGINNCTIMKTMKYGFNCLNLADLQYFEDFIIMSELIKIKEGLMEDYSNELILNLRPIGFSCSECWHIVISGILNQDQHTLLKLFISGIDIPRILNWCIPKIKPSKSVLQILTNIGIDEESLRITIKYGIDDEIVQIIKDLGYNVQEELLNIEQNVKCNSNMKSNVSCKSTHYTKNLTSLTDSTQKRHSLNLDESMITHYQFVKENLIESLTWSLKRTLNYNPSSPLHYLTQQLLQWRYNL
ncbi:uncharacterized protein [Prorops nasuta]|uniref:uncharacterized protein isoform X2 n=1 Tax=Prorops nasuta TaxID=863751 RepID=UPI0034CF9E87